MSNRKIILHFGFHKTASTSIQTTLAANKSVLESNNFSYPKICTDKPHNHNTPILSLFSAEPQNRQIHTKYGRDIEKVSQMNDDFIKAFTNAFTFPGDIILSAEGGSLLTKPELFELKTFFENHGLTPKVMIVVRTPLEFITSWASQRIKNGRHINENNLFFGRAKKIAELIDVFGENVEFFSFKVACRHENGPVGFFLSEIGITNQNQIKFKSSNISFSNQAIRIINDLNEKNALQNQDSPKSSRVCQADIKKLFKTPGNKYKLSIEEVTPILSKLEQENALIKELLGSDFCDKQSDYEKLKSIDDPEFLTFEAATMKSLSEISPTLKPHAQNLTIQFIAQNSTFNERELRDRIFSKPVIKKTNVIQQLVCKIINKFKNQDKI